MLLYRLLSRVVIVPFSGPGIQAHTPEQRDAFSSLKRLKVEASSSIGLFIAMGKAYREEGAFEVDRYEQRVTPLLQNCTGRTIKGYAHLIWFTEQASQYFCVECTLYTSTMCFPQKSQSYNSVIAP